MNFAIRIAEKDDASAISEIYNYYVDQSTCTFDLEKEPLSRRIEWLESHDQRHPIVVCTHGSSTIGWGSLSEWNSRPGYSRTAEVSFYVHHDWQRQGVGRLILAELIRLAEIHDHFVLIGGACTEQTASIRLQESFGFVQVAHFKKVGYKFGRWLDVAYYQRTLDPNQGREG